MATTKASQKAVNKYMKENYDRINLTLPKGSKDALKAHADSTGESVNAFIKRAITEVSDMDNMHAAYLRGLLRQLQWIQDSLDRADYVQAKKDLHDLIADTKNSI